MELNLLLVILRKMNLPLVYVTVCAISFVNSEFQVPFNNWQHNMINTDDEKLDIRNKDLQVENQTDGSSEIKKELFQGFSKLKNIYEDCVRKINKTYKKSKKVKVKAQLSELKNHTLALYKCIKVYSFRFLDQSLDDDLIPLTDHVYLVKDGVTGNGMARGMIPVREYARDVLAKDWTTLAHERMLSLLQSYSLKLHLASDKAIQGRGRRRDHRMFAMLVMGFIIMASILIPMGFQFLTVLGGKSLLLAKMALIMSAINGLKKIATSNVGYGFYHTGSEGHHDHIHHGFHEKHYVNPQHYNHQQYKR